MAGKARSRAAQAAKQLLDARVMQIEALDAAVAAQRDAEAAVEVASRAAADAAQAAQQAYGDARRAGWTDDELEQLGYTGARPPRSGPRARGGRKRAVGSAGDSTQGGEVGAEPAGVPAAQGTGQ